MNKKILIIRCLFFFLLPAIPSLGGKRCRDITSFYDNSLSSRLSGDFFSSLISKCKNNLYRCSTSGIKIADIKTSMRAIANHFSQGRAVWSYKFFILYHYFLFYTQISSGL